MNTLPRKSFRTISVIAAICLFQGYVLAGATTPNVATNLNPTPNAPGLMMGRLLLAGTDSTVLVNGFSANSGTTILSGSQLQTPANVDATVQLGSAGKLFIEPNTNLTVTFDKTNVEVKVTAGKAFVVANAGVVSSVTAPDGSTSATGGEPGTPAPMPKLTHGQTVAAWLIPVVVVTVIVIVVVTRNSSPS
jgi:hypothetical protein